MKVDEEDIKTKADDDFLKIPLHQWNVQERNPEKYGISRVNEFLPYFSIACLVLVVLVGAATGYLWMQVHTLNTGIKNLSAAVNSIDVGNFKSRLTTAETSLEQMNKENGRLKSELARLTSEIEAMRAKERADAAAALKQAAAKKKPAAVPKRTR